MPEEVLAAYGNLKTSQEKCKYADTGNNMGHGSLSRTLASAISSSRSCGHSSDQVVEVSAALSLHFAH